MRADCLPYARVSVLVNGIALTEYTTEIGDGQGATTFIEAVPGATFTVELELEAAFAAYTSRKRNDKLTFCLFLDGEAVCSNLVYLNVRPVTSTLGGIIEQKHDETTLRPFVFAEHTTTDSTADTSLIRKLANLGEIKIELKRCRTTGLVHGKNTPAFKGIGDDPLPEKATKGRSISNHAKLGQGVAVPKHQWMDVEYPYGLKSIATYKFQYRSRRDLEIEGILEHPASPAPQVPLEKRDPERLTLEELREQLRLLRARESATNMKQEFKPERSKRARSATLGQDNRKEDINNEENNDDKDDEVTITADWDRRKRARASAEGAEVIDLTED